MDEIDTIANTALDTYGHPLYQSGVSNIEILRSNDYLDLNDGVIINPEYPDRITPRLDVDGNVIFDPNNTYNTMSASKWFAFDVSTILSWLKEALYANADLGIDYDSLIDLVVTDYPMINLESYKKMTGLFGYNDPEKMIYESIYISLFSEISKLFIGIGNYQTVLNARLVGNLLLVNVPVIIDINN